MKRRWIWITTGIFVVVLGGFFMSWNFLFPVTQGKSHNEKEVLESEFKEGAIDEDGRRMEVDVEADKVWTFEFLEPIDRETVHYESVSVLSQGGERAVFEMEVSDDGKSLDIIPRDGEWEEGETYELLISDEVLTVEGAPLSSPVEMVFLIEREEIEEAVWNPDLMEISAELVTSIDDENIELKRTEATGLLKVEDIIVLPVETEFGIGEEAFEITAMEKGVRTIQLTVKRPLMTHLFESLDIYKTYNLLGEDTEIILADGVTMVTENDDIADLGEVSFDDTLVTSLNHTEAKKKKKPPNKVTFHVNEEFTMKGIDVAVDADIDMEDPELIVDYKISGFSVKRLNFSMTQETEAFVSAEVLTSAAYLRNWKNKYKNTKGWIAEKETTVAQWRVPTSVPGLYTEYELEVVFGVTAEGKVEAKTYVAASVEQEYGFAKKGADFIPYAGYEQTMEAGINGNGVLDSKTGPAFDVELKALGVVSLGIEGEIGGYAQGQAYAEATAQLMDSGDGAEAAVTKGACYKAEAGLLTALGFEAELGVDNTRWEVEWEENFLEKRAPLIDYDTCQYLKAIKGASNKETYFQGETAIVNLVGDWEDLITKEITAGKMWTEEEKSATNVSFDVLGGDILFEKSNETKFKEDLHVMHIPIANDAKAGDYDILVTYKDEKTGDTLETVIPVSVEQKKEITIEQIDYKEIDTDDFVMYIYLPQLRGLVDIEKEKAINEMFVSYGEKTMNMVEETWIERNRMYMGGAIQYQINHSNDNYISLSLKGNYYGEQSEHPTLSNMSYIIDLKEEEIVTLADLFESGTDIEDVLIENMSGGVYASGNYHDIPLTIEELEYVLKNGTFYLTEDALVLNHSPDLDGDRIYSYMEYQAKKTALPLRVKFK